ncbi:hypothetical protein B0H66DRAFT_570355 [Apodospora peruviana]|uniref:Uncharacterized protein n=1 Tax=Apodospora peruviana TaxID=516989 RepID=A0AAE0LYD0_9PEZI|nr:hypothetical protein B0H66DRAFT_570355 [Apodospora peruviana]
MNRLASRIVSPSTTMSSSSRILSLSSRLYLNRPAAATEARTYGTTSAPKEAEEASAQSGGSRSKDAKETGESPTAGVVPDSLAEGGAKGRTGGGKPLKSSDHASPQPKINSFALPGDNATLTDEQKKEVDEHNRDFDKKHGKAEPASNDKVDKDFWSGQGGRETGNKKGP